jgi:hypothetical protein
MDAQINHRIDKSGNTKIAICCQKTAKMQNIGLSFPDQ